MCIIGKKEEEEDKLTTQIVLIHTLRAEKHWGFKRKKSF